MRTVNQAQYEKLGIRGLEAIVLMDPYFTDAHFKLGLKYLDAHRYEDAVRSLREAAALEPSEPCHRGYLGRALFELGEYAASRNELLAALDLDPTGFDGHFHLWLGDTLVALHRRQEAVTAYWNALDYVHGWDANFRLADLSIDLEIKMPRPADFTPPYYDDQQEFQTFGKPGHCRLRLFDRGAKQIALLTEDRRSSGDGPVNHAESVFATIVKKFNLDPQNLVFVTHFEQGILRCAPALSRVTFTLSRPPAPPQPSALAKLFGVRAAAPAALPLTSGTCRAEFHRLSSSEFERLSGFRLYFKESEDDR